MNNLQNESINNPLYSIPPGISSQSYIITKNFITGEISYVQVKDIVPDIHEIYSIKSKNFVPIVYNFVTDQIENFILIETNTISYNKPYQDLYVTSHQKIIVDESEILAGDLPWSKLIKTNPQSVHTICTIEPDIIMVNDLNMVTISYDELANIQN